MLGNAESEVPLLPWITKASQPVVPQPLFSILFGHCLSQFPTFFRDNHAQSLHRAALLPSE